MEVSVCELRCVLWRCFRNCAVGHGKQSQVFSSTMNALMGLAAGCDQQHAISSKNMAILAQQI